jgi:hypothetical protein
MKTIGEFITGRRKQLSLSQKELVALIKNRDGKPLSMPYLGYLENGRGEPPGVPAQPCLVHLPPVRSTACRTACLAGGWARALATDRGGGQALELQPSRLTG